MLRRGDDVLLTRLAPHVSFRGWTLPGGGVDHGEHPRDALRREIREETGYDAEPGRLVDVWSTHFTGARPDGFVEDYHGIGLIFEAELSPEAADMEPEVLDVGGSTDLAAWFPLAQAVTLSLTGAARLALTRLIEQTEELA